MEDIDRLNEQISFSQEMELMYGQRNVFEEQMGQSANLLKPKNTQYLDPISAESNLESTCDG